MNFDAPAFTWMPSPRSAMTLTFDPQNLIRSSVGGRMNISRKSHRDCTSCSWDIVATYLSGRTNEHGGRTARWARKHNVVVYTVGWRMHNKNLKNNVCAANNRIAWQPLGRAFYSRCSDHALVQGTPRHRLQQFCLMNILVRAQKYANQSIKINQKYF